MVILDFKFKFEFKEEILNFKIEMGLQIGSEIFTCLKIKTGNWICKLCL